jgi:uncharacterized LabA/DUF88 family protein
MRDRRRVGRVARVPKPSAVVYVDGLNLYKGQLESRPENKWLDLERLFDSLLDDYSIERIHYFTAHVRGRANPDDPTAPDRQAAYLRALETLTRVTIHRSQFTIHPSRARLRGTEGVEWADVWKVQEKGSDVKLAVQLVVDAFDGGYDAYVVVSSDSDLGSALDVAVNRFDRHLIVVYPRDERTKEFERVGVRSSLYLRPSLVAESQLPDVMVSRSGRVVRRPSGWTKQGPAEAGP